MKNFFLRVSRRLDERGFFLLETVVLGLLVTAAAAVLPVLRQGEINLARTQSLIAADYLAKEQIAHLLDLPTITSGAVGWLGDSAALTANGWQYRVETAISGEANGVYRATVTVTGGDGRQTVSRTLTRRLLP